MGMMVAVAEVACDCMMYVCLWYTDCVNLQPTICALRVLFVLPVLFVSNKVIVSVCQFQRICTGNLIRRLLLVVTIVLLTEPSAAARTSSMYVRLIAVK